MDSLSLFLLVSFLRHSFQLFHFCCPFKLLLSDKKKVCLPLSKAHYYLQIQQTSAAIVGKNAIILKPQN